jgi:hypothetical protein
MQEIGIARLHRIGRVGPYELSEKSYDSGPTWEDLRAGQYRDELLVGPAVVFRHGADWQRLDHFISGNPDLPLDTRLAMIRQLAEAVSPNAAITSD